MFVCGGGGLGAQDVPAALARLVLASVVEPVHDPGGVLTPRFRMSAAVREFGAERLRSAGEAAAAISRHLYWYGHVASTAHHLWSTGLHERATALVRDGEADLCAALTRRPSGADQASRALALAVDLWFWWALCGNAREGREHLLRLLPLGRTDTPVCGQALWLAGWLAVCTGSPDATDLLGQPARGPAQRATTPPWGGSATYWGRSPWTRAGRSGPSRICGRPRTRFPHTRSTARPRLSAGRCWPWHRPRPGGPATRGAASVGPWPVPSRGTTSGRAA